MTSQLFLFNFISLVLGFKPIGEIFNLQFETKSEDCNNLHLRMSLVINNTLPIQKLMERL